MASKPPAIALSLCTLPALCHCSAQQVYMCGQLGGYEGNIGEQCQESITVFALRKMQMD